MEGGADETPVGEIEEWFGAELVVLMGGRGFGGTGENGALWRDSSVGGS